MALLAHLVIALASLIFTTYLYIRPSGSKIKIAQVLVAATLGSGSYLVWSTRSPMLQSCISGLAYLAIVSIGIVMANRKLAAGEDRTE